MRCLRNVTRFSSRGAIPPLFYSFGKTFIQCFVLISLLRFLRNAITISVSIQRHSHKPLLVRERIHLEKLVWYSEILYRIETAATPAKSGAMSWGASAMNGIRRRKAFSEASVRRMAARHGGKRFPPPQPGDEKEKSPERGSFLFPSARYHSGILHFFQYALLADEIRAYRILH